MSKKLGQVFLKNKSIQRQITDYILNLEGDYWMEIGPGLGALTSYVYESKLDRLSMVEIDEGFVVKLKEKFPRSNLICGDFLEITEAHLNGETILFGNIPYYITSPIILKFLKTKLFSEAILMVQREYFEVITAPSKNNRYSSMSVLVQSFTSQRRVLDVHRKNFNPVPKVDSTVVHLIKDKNGEIDVEEYANFLRKCFHMPRKTLMNNLREYFPREQLERLFDGLGINPKARPEEQDQEIFIYMFKVLVSLKTAHP